MAIKEKQVTYTIYIADDETEFEDKEQCAKHNSKLARKKVVSAIPSKSVPEFDEHFGGCIYYIKNDDELKELVEYSKYDRFNLNVIYTSITKFEGEGWYYASYREQMMFTTREHTLYISKVEKDSLEIKRTCELVDAFGVRSTLEAEYEAHGKRATPEEVLEATNEVDRLYSELSQMLDEKVDSISYENRLQRLLIELYDVIERKQVITELSQPIKGGK